MVQNIILAVILAAAVFFAVIYFRKVFSGKGSCCSDSRANCTMKDRGCRIG